MTVCVLVESLIREITGDNYRYDMDAAIPVITKVYQDDMSARDALRYIDERLAIDRAGCCFNWGGALAYRLLQEGKKVVIVETPEDNGQKVSVAYCDGNKLYVADIVEYIKGEKAINEICAIPYEEFAEPFKNQWIKLFDVDKINKAYCTTLMSPNGNTSPEEFLESH